MYQAALCPAKRAPSSERLHAGRKRRNGAVSSDSTVLVVVVFYGAVSDLASFRGAAFSDAVSGCAVSALAVSG